MIRTIKTNSIETCTCDGCKNVIYKQILPIEKCYYEKELKKLNPHVVKLIRVERVSTAGTIRKYYCEKCFFDIFMSRFTDDKLYKLLPDNDEFYCVKFYKARCCDSDFNMEGDKSDECD